ncbi:hypothetical protein FDZ71_07085 [bacterium]|nr:MAG: hypothetical protein FDZ71_07085 [bacterium]
MPYASNLKKVIDLPRAIQLTSLPATTAAGACWCADKRGTGRFIYLLLGAASFWRYDVQTNTFQQLANPPTLSFAAGCAMTFDPSRGSAGYVWLTAPLTSSPWHMFAYYDVAANAWTSRSAVSGLGAAFGTDAYLCHTCATYNAGGNDDYLYLIGNNSTTWYRFSITGNAWTAYTGGQLLPAAAGAGCSIHWPYGWQVDRLYYFRGTATAALYYYTISTTTWSAIQTIIPATETFTTGTCAFNAAGGQYLYVQKDATHRVYRIDLSALTIEPFITFPYVSTAIIGDNLLYIAAPDGAEYLYYRRQTGTEFWRILIAAARTWPV